VGVAVTEARLAPLLLSTQSSETVSLAATVVNAELRFMRAITAPPAEPVSTQVTLVAWELRRVLVQHDQAAELLGTSATLVAAYLGT